MTPRMRLAVLIALASATLPTFAVEPAMARASGAAGIVAAVDADKDGTIDLTEARAAAVKLFDRLDTDRDGTIGIKELQGRVSRREFTAVNPDKDGTLDKSEFLALLDRRFKAADPDDDGTIDTKELGTPAGRLLTHLLK